MKKKTEGKGRKGRRREERIQRINLKSIYLSPTLTDTDKDAFTLWPNIGPHIVEFPGQGTVYVREDHAKTAKLTCTAVGENDIKYQWKTFNDVSKMKFKLSNYSVNLSFLH